MNENYNITFIGTRIEEAQRLNGNTSSFFNKNCNYQLNINCVHNQLFEIKFKTINNNSGFLFLVW